ncbi:MAG: thioredoxin [Bacteroidetes bacterium]|nr:thioredoxin [Bacteroidota bacterium]
MAIEINDANFTNEVINSQTPVLVDFWASWCGPCKMIAPTIEELHLEFINRVKVCKMDVDANPSTPMQFGIRSIPTLLIFKNGKVVDQVVGVRSKGDLTELLTKHISN